MADNQTSPLGIAVDSTYVYWVTRVWQGVFGLYRAPLDGGLADLMASSAPGALQGSLVIDSSTAYWNSGTTLETLPLDGGEASVLEGDLPNDQVSGKAIDSSYVYWSEGTSLTDPTKGIVVRVHK